MTESTSFYGILNVAPDADQGVIEAAYRALMKKYHPDRLGGQAGAAPKRAAEINEAYAVLRDPAKRALYDAEASKRHQASLAPVVYRAGPAEPRRRFGAGGFLAVLVLVAAGVYAISGMAGPRPQAPAPVAEMGSQPDPAMLDKRADAPDQARVRGPVDRANVTKAVAEFTRLRPSGLDAVMEYSMRCFRRQQDTQRLADFDHCVAFDEAAGTFEALGAAPGEALAPRFAPHVLSVRHINAGRLMGDDHRWIETRLAEIRGITNVALADALERAATAGVAQAALPDAAADAAAPAVRRPRRLAERPRGAGQRRPPRARPKQAEGDFLEREGYIY